MYAFKHVRPDLGPSVYIPTSDRCAGLYLVQLSFQCSHHAAAQRAQKAPPGRDRAVCLALLRVCFAGRLPIPALLPGRPAALAL